MSQRKASRDVKLPPGSSRKKLKAKRTGNEDPAQRLLLDCAKNGWVDRLEKMLSSENSPSQQTVDALFLIAAEFGQTDIVRMLVGKISSLFIATKRGSPAILLAARNGHLATTRLLLEIGVGIETRDSNGDTPLLGAVEYGHEDIAAWLIQNGADVNAMDDDRNSVLHVAAYSGNTKLVRLLLEAGAATNVLNDEDETPLEIAKNLNIVRTILEFSARIKKPASALKKVPVNPYKQLPQGASTFLFWSSIGVGKDNFMFQQFGVYPFDRLNETERIILLTEVTERIAGYKNNVTCDVLHESTLFAVFAMMKARVKKEIESVDSDDVFDTSFVWRRRVLEAYEQVFSTSASYSGLSVECVKKDVWNTVIDLLASSLFGPSFWDKLPLFTCPFADQRRVTCPELPDEYFTATLPNSDQLAQGAVQLIFKKLMTMSKSYLCEEVLEPSGCFCQDCIAEREVPLTFKLQFLEETAEEKRRSKKNKKSKEKIKVDSDVSEEVKKLDSVIETCRNELKNFWASLPVEERWNLTEIQVSDLHEIISQSPKWETLRSALQSYSKYSWDDDRLELSDECITIIEDVGETKGMDAVLLSMLDSVKELNVPVPLPKGSSKHLKATDIYSREVCDEFCEFKVHLDHAHDEEWDLRDRRLLENIVLAEFARKIAGQYILKKEESRAQRLALELELELQQEEEQLQKNADKKSKKKKSKSKKKKKNTLSKDTTGDAIPSEGEKGPEESMRGKEQDIASEDEYILQLANDLAAKATLDAKASRAKTKKSTNVVIVEPKTEDATGESSQDESADERPISNASIDDVEETIGENRLYRDSGMMFICTDETFQEAMRLKIMGLPRQHLRSVKSIDPENSLLFLFNITTRMLHGIFEPVGPGGENINPTAWSRSRGPSKFSPFPAQIRFDVPEDCAPLPESQFRYLFPDGNRIRKLNSKQVQELVDMFLDSYREEPAEHNEEDFEDNHAADVDDAKSDPVSLAETTSRRENVFLDASIRVLDSKKSDPVVTRTEIPQPIKPDPIATSASLASLLGIQSKPVATSPIAPPTSRLVPRSTLTPEPRSHSAPGPVQPEQSSPSRPVGADSLNWKDDPPLVVDRKLPFGSPASTLPIGSGRPSTVGRMSPSLASTRVESSLNQSSESTGNRPLIDSPLSLFGSWDQVWKPSQTQHDHWASHPQASSGFPSKFSPHGSNLSSQGSSTWSPNPWGTSIASGWTSSSPGWSETQLHDSESKNHW